MQLAEGPQMHRRTKRLHCSGDQPFGVCGSWECGKWAARRNPRYKKNNQGECVFVDEHIGMKYHLFRLELHLRMTPARFVFWKHQSNQDCPLRPTQHFLTARRW